jgi:hypothetical protein
METKIFATCVGILLVAAYFDIAEGYELTETETTDWCQFYSELAGEFHQLAQDSDSKDEYAITAADYIRQLDEIAKASDWTEANRLTWIPEFKALAVAAWELRTDLQTDEVEQVIRNQCLENHSQKGDDDGLREIQNWIA